MEKKCEYCEAKATTEVRASKRGKTAFKGYTCDKQRCQLAQKKDFNAWKEGAKIAKVEYQ